MKTTNDYRELTRRLDAFDARLAAQLETLRRDAARPERSRQTPRLRKSGRRVGEGDQK